VGPALEGPLKDYRVVCLGPVAPEHQQIIPCLDQAPLPEELVAAVERLAAAAGNPVALLVTDPSLVERSGRDRHRKALQKQIYGRFPLWVVDGPESWEPWPENK